MNKTGKRKYFSMALLLLCGMLAAAGLSACGEEPGGDQQVAGSRQEVIYGYIRDINRQARTVTVDQVEVIREDDHLRREELELSAADFTDGIHYYNGGGQRMYPISRSLALEMAGSIGTDLGYQPGGGTSLNSGSRVMGAKTDTADRTNAGGMSMAGDRSQTAAGSDGRTLQQRLEKGAADILASDGAVGEMMDGDGKLISNDIENAADDVMNAAEDVLTGRGSAAYGNGDDVASMSRGESPYAADDGLGESMTDAIIAGQSANDNWPADQWAGTPQNRGELTESHGTGMAGNSMGMNRIESAQDYRDFAAHIKEKPDTVYMLTLENGVVVAISAQNGK